MKVALGNDHAGTEMRAVVIDELVKMGHEVVDLGHPGTESVDYPDYARRVAEAVLSKRADQGVLICGTGIGMSMAANKFPGIRCALCTDLYGAEMTRHHNNANVLALGSRNIDPERVRGIVRTFFSEPFDGGRHQRRLDKIAEIERNAGGCGEGR